MTTLNEISNFKNQTDRLEDKIYSASVTAAVTVTSIATNGIPHSLQGVKEMWLVSSETVGTNDIPAFTGTLTFVGEGLTLDTFGFTMGAVTAGGTTYQQLTAAASLIELADNYTISCPLLYTAAYTVDLRMKKLLKQSQGAGPSSAVITWNTSSDPVDVREVNPKNLNVTSWEESITNTTGATTSRYFDMTGVPYWTYAQNAVEATSVTTFHFSNDLGVAASAASYEDMTTALLSAVNLQGDNFHLRTEPLIIKFMRIDQTNISGTFTYTLRAGNI